MNRGDRNQFWSSEGSLSSEANEWLLYKTSDDKGAVVSSFSIKVFDPSEMQYVDYKYAPRAVQLEIGSSRDSFSFKS